MDKKSHDFQREQGHVMRGFERKKVKGKWCNKIRTSKPKMENLTIYSTH